MNSLAKQEKVLNEDKIVEVRFQEKGVIAKKQALLLFTQAFAHFQKKPRIRSMKHMTINEKISHCWQNRTLFPENFERIDFVALKAMETTNTGLKNEMYIITLSPQEECYYRVEPGQSNSGSSGSRSRRSYCR